jgi:hypothetical protein
LLCLIQIFQRSRGLACHFSVPALL